MLSSWMFDWNFSSISVQIRNGHNDLKRIEINQKLYDLDLSPARGLGIEHKKSCKTFDWSLFECRWTGVLEEKGWELEKNRTNYGEQLHDISSKRGSE